MQCENFECFAAFFLVLQREAIETIWRIKIEKKLKEIVEEKVGRGKLIKRGDNFQKSARELSLSPNYIFNTESKAFTL